MEWVEFRVETKKTVGIDSFLEKLGCKWVLPIKRDFKKKPGCV